ncbi:hypothetical protein PTKIN_Ptkin14bG0118600 [Pterospermum kingtungense]
MSGISRLWIVKEKALVNMLSMWVKKYRGRGEILQLWLVVYTTVTLQYLPNLMYLYVKDCNAMEELLVSEPELEEEQMDSRNTITFTRPALVELKLEDLRELKSIYNANGGMDSSALEKIWIKNCPNLKRIPLYCPYFLYEIWIEPKEQWESLEWDDPLTKSLLEPLLMNWDKKQCHLQHFHRNA